MSVFDKILPAALRRRISVSGTNGTTIKTDAGWLSWPKQGTNWNWWQLIGDRPATEYAQFAPVFACWRVISEEIARVPVYVANVDENNVRTRNTRIAAARILRKPNSFQTISDFLLYVGWSLLSDGNAYIYGPRNDRNERKSAIPLHPKKVKAYIAEEDGDVYYHLSDSQMVALENIQEGFWIPARDICHIRLFTFDHPLVGITPLSAATLGINAGMNINAQTAAFFGNMSRPSVAITHPKAIKDNSIIQRIKEAYKNATAGANTGEPIVLQDGMTISNLTMSAVDAEIIQSYKLTEKQVAQVYRVPPFFLGDFEVAKIASVEAIMNYFINSGFGFYLTHISNALHTFFDLNPDQEVVFDFEEALLRGDFKGRIEAYKVAVQGGLLNVNEARKMLRHPPVEYGDHVRMQQQMVPLSYGENLQPDSTPAVPANKQMSAGQKQLVKLHIKNSLRKTINEIAA